MISSEDASISTNNHEGFEIAYNKNHSSEAGLEISLQKTRYRYQEQRKRHLFKHVLPKLFPNRQIRRKRGKSYKTKGDKSKKGYKDNPVHVVADTDDDDDDESTAAMSMTSSVETTMNTACTVVINQNDKDDLRELLLRDIFLENDNNHNFFSEDERIELILVAQQWEASLLLSDDNDNVNTDGNGEKETILIVIPNSNTGDQQEDTDNFINVPSLMEQRLLATGLLTKDDFEFIPDTISKEVLESGLVNHMSARSGDNDKNTNNNISHVKTGVWEISTMKSENNNVMPNEPFYVVTAVCMEDKVDTKKLRKLLFPTQSGKNKNKINSNKRCRPKIAMAPTEIAENLVGYKSGTMAPICHTKNMKLFLEESILAKSSNQQKSMMTTITDKSGNGNGNKNNNDCGQLVVDITNNDGEIQQQHKLYVGSGMFGKCLSIPIDKFIQIAMSSSSPSSKLISSIENDSYKNKCTGGIEICSLIQKKKK